MQIQFPRRIRLGFRPWYGLTLRQLGYLVVAGGIAGAIVLFGPVEGSDLLIRVLIGLMVITIGVALAFFRKDGLSAEQWLATQVKFWMRPQKRVWTRSDAEGSAAHDQIAEIAIDQPLSDARGTPEAIEDDAAGTSALRLLRPTARSASAPAAVVVLIDMAMLFALFVLAVYLARGGLNEIQSWFVRQMGGIR